jgi:hypothetical protein
LGQPSNQTGVWESESGDLLYNNYFSVPSAAFTPTFDPLSCQISCVTATYKDTWNVTDESATASQTVLGVVLSGSIIGTSYQGGSFWSNYGMPSNPYGVLPYNDSGQITFHGDYVPLVPFTLYTVTFRETGLAAGVRWGVATAGATVNTTANSLVVEDPNGTNYAFSVLTPSGYTVAIPSGTFNVSGANLAVTVTFEPVFTATFQESGLPAGYAWNVSLIGPGTGGVAVVQATTNTSLNFSAVHGSYRFIASSAGYNAVPATGTIVLGPNNVTTTITFTLAAELTFTETGLPGGTAWTVALTQGGATTQVSSVGPTITFNVFDSVAGPYTFQASSPGYNATPASGAGTLPANATQSVVFAARPGILGLTVTPTVAETFYVDGVLAGHVTGSFGWPLAPGIHAIELVASGYEPYFNNVTMTAGGSVSLHVTLVAVPSSSSSGVGTLGWELIALLAAVAVVFLVTTLIFLRRARRPPAGAATGPPQPWQEEAAPSPPKAPPPSVGP